MTDQREKRIQEIQKYVNDTKRWNHKHPELKHDPALPMADVDFLLTELYRLQVERDKAIAERDELLYELREAQERGSLD